MPYAAPRPCLAPACPELVRSSGYCDRHRSERTAYDRRRGSAARRGYDSTWRPVRLAYLQRVGWRCERCGARPADTSRLHVHHVVPLRDGGARLNPSNLQALCESCHNALPEHRL